MDEATLRALLRQVTPGDEPPACPEEAVLAAYADGSLQSAPREDFEMHLAACLHCREQIAFLLQPDAPETPVPAGLLGRARQLVAPPATPLLWRWRWGMATAAAAVLLLVVFVREQVPPPAGVPEESTPAPAVTPPEPRPVAPVGAPEKNSKGVRSVAPGAAGLRILAPEEGGRLSVERLNFRWQEVPGRVFYEVVVTTPEGALIWQGRTESTEIRVPGDSVPAGGKYYLWIRAHLPGGKTALSDIRSFETVAP